MIEEVMKAVKRGNKKRSINITVGAVVGFLLSCTAVMGAAVEIKPDNSGEQFAPTTTIEGNTFDEATKTYTNNEEMTTDTGISISGVPTTNKNLNIVNNGTINADKIGISVASGAEAKGNIINNGTIESKINGIVLGGTLEGDIINNGTVKIVAEYTGLQLSGTLNGNVINKGEISSGYGGIRINNTGSVKKDINNEGVINNKSVPDNSGEFYNTSDMEIDGTVEGSIKNSGMMKSENTAGNSDTGDKNSSSIWIKGMVKKDIENTGTITSRAASDIASSVGIDNSKTVEGSIKNSGIMKSENTGSGRSYAINVAGTVTGDIVNNGLIKTTTNVREKVANGIVATGTVSGGVLNTGYIVNIAGGIGTGISFGGNSSKIVNKGYLSTKSTFNFGARGIDITESTSKEIDVLNEGLIKNNSSEGSLSNTAITIRGVGKGTNLTNSGVVHGKNCVLLIRNGASIKNGINYGIFVTNKDVSSSSSILSGLHFADDTTLAENKIVNYGLAFTAKEDGTYTMVDTRGSNVRDDEERNLLNAGKITDIDTNAVTGTESIEISNLTSSESYILNGIGDTLKVTGKNNELNGSIVNAYKTAVVMADGAEFSAEDTVFNGGADWKSKTIKLAGNNTLNITGESIVNGDVDAAGGNNALNMDGSTMNGDIAAAGDSNALSFKNGNIVNGETEITGTGNTLEITEGSIQNGDITATGDNTKLALDKSILNGNMAAKGSNSDISISDSILNGDIGIDGDGNTLAISGEDTYINGNMASTGNNTLNIAGKTTDGNSLNMFHEVSGFNEMNIASGSVTFFEDSKVTGTEKVTVAEDATLNLRVKKSGSGTVVDGLDEGAHAFSENGKVTMEGLDKGGTLKFITNGIGQGVWLDTEDMTIKNMHIATNSALDKFKFDKDGNLVIAVADSLEGLNPSGTKVEDSKDTNIWDGNTGAGGNTGDGDDILNENIFTNNENFGAINKIYGGIYNSSKNDVKNLEALKGIMHFDRNSEIYAENTSDEEQLKNLQAYLNEVYTQSPYALSSELSRKSAGMFRDIVTDNMFRPNLNQWMIMGGLTHIDGGTKDTYYGEVYEMDGKNSLGTKVDTKLTGAYALGKYGYSENVALGVTVGGNRSEAKLSRSKVKGNSGYIGAFAENYRGNLTLKAGAGVQYSEYDADRATIGGHSYSDKYSDMTYDIYLNGRYSHNIGDNLFLEPYAALSYTYVDQDGADEGNKALAMKTDSKSFDYTAAKVGLDLKKVIPHEIGKSTLSAGVSYTRLLSGADADSLRGNFGGSDFDILVASKNEHSLGLNARYALELQSGVLFDVKGSYSFERDSHNDNGRNRNKGEWIVGAGLGYKF